MLLEVSIIIIALLLVVVVTVLISTLLISTPKKENVATDGTVDSRPTAWSEHIRNMKDYMTFPPCYDIDSNAKKIYAILERNDLIQRYQNILDILSILLCLEKKQADECRPLDLKDRFTQIIGMGGDTTDKQTREIVAAFIQIDESLKSRFIVGAVNLIEKNMATLLKDRDMTKTDKEQISGYIYSFYAMHLPLIHAKCKYD
jgi:hypothetical protein